MSSIPTIELGLRHVVESADFLFRSTRLEASIRRMRASKARSSSASIAFERASGTGAARSRSPRRARPPTGSESRAGRAPGGPSRDPAAPPEYVVVRVADLGGVVLIIASIVPPQGVRELSDPRTRFVEGDARRRRRFRRLRLRCLRLALAYRHRSAWLLVLVGVRAGRSPASQLRCSTEQASCSEGKFHQGGFPRGR